MRLRRQVWVIAHRWAGLTLALFLTIAGITGMLLAFYDEIEPALTPHVHLVQPPTPRAELLDPHELRAKVQGTYPGAIINYLPLHLESGRSVKLDIRRIDAVSGKLKPWSNEIDEVFVDPYTGRITGQRLWGDITQGAINFMPFVYRLHYTLIAGTTGRYVLGIAALIWTLDAFIGFYLTLPRRRRREHTGIATSAQSWWSRWKPSWLLRWTGGQSKLTFDLHRAGGLWLWPMLFVFAWSGVTFNLDEVYDPVMKLFGRERLQDGLVTLAQPRHDPQLGFAAAADRGRALAEKEVAQRGLIIDSHGASALQFRLAHGVYVYYFSTDRDFTVRGGRSMLVFDGDTGEIRKLLLPQGANGGHTFTEWIIALHMGRVWGLPYRIAVSVTGLMVTVLSVTGVVIWMRKRQARSFANAKLTRRYDDDDSQALAPTMEPALRRE